MMFWLFLATAFKMSLSLPNSSEVFLIYLPPSPLPTAEISLPPRSQLLSVLAPHGFFQLPRKQCNLMV
jgi:hypothetical protein